MIIVLQFVPIIFIFGCDNVKKETNKIICRCRDIAKSYDGVPAIRQQVDNLVYKMESLNNIQRYNAGGFCTIRRSLLLSLSGASMTYFLTFDLLGKKIKRI